MVFSLSLEEELKNKPFLATKNLAKSLSHHINNIAKNCDLPTFHYDEHKQFGCNFGSRFSNALLDVYNKGYDAIIAIGGDVPHLELKHIQQAKGELLKGNNVLGPTFDGGFYLLGISKKDFNHNTFIDLSWNSETIYDEICLTFSVKKTTTALLQKLRDIDYFSDIRKLNLKFLRSAILRQIIQNINASNQGNYNYFYLHSFQPLNKIPFNKGSPFATSFYLKNEVYGHV